MHANTFKRTPMAGGPVRRAASASDTEPERRLNATSALLILLAAVGIVVTFLFGMWMIDFGQPHG